MSDNIHDPAAVIPRRWPQAIGVMEDVDGIPVQFTLNHDGTVRITIATIGGGSHTGASADLDKQAREEFMRLWCEAERQAEASVPP